MNEYHWNYWSAIYDANQENDLYLKIYSDVVLARQVEKPTHECLHI